MTQRQRVFKVLFKNANKWVSTTEIVKVTGVRYYNTSIKNLRELGNVITHREEWYKYKGKRMYESYFMLIIPAPRKTLLERIINFFKQL